CEIRDDETGTPRHHLAHLHREIVGFAARTREDGVPELLRERRQQLLGERERLLAQVARMRVEDARLVADRLHDGRVTMAHDGNVVIRVEITATLLVVHPQSLGTHYLERLVVEEPMSRRKHPGTAGEQGGAITAWDRQTVNSSSSNRLASSSRALMKRPSRAAKCWLEGL